MSTALNSIMRSVDRYAQLLGISWKQHQLEAFVGWEKQDGGKACLFFKTGSGKTATSLAMIRLSAENHVLVIAPPSTHASWRTAAGKLGISIDTISHAKFRQKDYLLSRETPMIVDEFHLLGGRNGQGWKKLDRFAAGTKSDLIICSATPNYNDAERVYCVQHVLDPDSCRGGFLEFLYQHCNTKQNHFSQVPDVDDKKPFKQFKDAADYLVNLPNVYYLEDDAQYDIEDIDVETPMPLALEMYGYEGREHRMIASRIEEKHTRTYLGLVGNNGEIHPHVLDIVDLLVRGATSGVLIFVAHSKIAHVLDKTWRARGGKPDNDELFKVYDHDLVDGKTTAVKKDAIIQAFRDQRYKTLIGTASLATGTDGLDKVCDTLIILDDTDDDSLRRQLVGRILKRGFDNEAARTKKIFRINLNPL